MLYRERRRTPIDFFRREAEIGLVVNWFNHPSSDFHFVLRLRALGNLFRYRPSLKKTLPVRLCCNVRVLEQVLSM